MQFTNILQLMQKFNDEQTCRKELEKMIWNGKQRCPHCTSEEFYSLADKKTYKCKGCKKKYTVTVGTIFHDSKIPLQKWFLAIYLIASHKKGISSVQLSKDLGITQKSAWFMGHRIRQLFSSEIEPITTVAYLDEAYIGGKSKNKHKNKRTPNTTGRNLKDKIAVWGVMEEGGQVYCTPVPNVKQDTLIPLVYKYVESGSTIVTDDWQAYGNLGKHYTHYKVNHGAGQYVDYDDPSIHTNCMENYWSQVKRSIMGCYHKMTRKHLERYCQEWQYRYNLRHMEDSHKFIIALQQSAGRRLTYKQLIS